MKFFNTSLHEEIFVKFNNQEAATKRCFYLSHFEISASVSSLESALTSAMQKIYFCFRIFFFFFFFLKNRIFMFFLVLSYGISTTLLQIRISLRFPIYSLKSVQCCSGKRLFELSEVSIHWHFEKITASIISAYFPAKHLGWSPF